MKVRMRLLLAAGTALFLPSAGMAQDLRFYINGGLSLPADPAEFPDLWNVAPSFGGGVGIRVAPEWELVGIFHVQRFPADEAAHIDDLLLVDPTGEVFEIASLDGRDATVVTLMAESRFHFPTRFRRLSPFLAFGAGYFEFAISPATFTPDGPNQSSVRFDEEIDSALGASVGAGIGFDVTPRIRMIFDSIYTIGFTEPVSAQYLPLRIGVGIS